MVIAPRVGQDRRSAAKNKLLNSGVNWGSDRPADGACMDNLIQNHGFSDSGARDFLKVYDATISFAKLSDSDKVPPGNNNSDENGTDDPPPPVAAKKPKRVRAVQDHDGRKWAFVEGSETGIPMEQVRIEQKGGGKPSNAPPTLPEERADRLPVGEREWLRGPLSRETSYRLIVTGDLGPKEIGKLIKLLTALKAVLSDEDDDNSRPDHED